MGDGHLMDFADCSQLVITDNSAGRAGTALVGDFNNLVRLTGAGDYFVVTGNNSAGLANGTLIENTTAATRTAIANNI
jgi:hypothetical protein